MSSLAVEGTLMSMVEQILPSLVREKTFDFNAVAAEIESEFGLVMTVDEIRLAFAKSELKNSSLQGEEQGVQDDSSSEDSEEEDYNSYPDRFGRSGRQKRRQEPGQKPSSSSWLSFDENQQETKEEKITHEDGSNRGSPTNYQAPSGSTNVRATSTNATTVTPTNDDSVPDLTLSLPSASVMESLIAELAAEKGLPPPNGSDDSVNNNEPKSEMQQVLEILAQPDDASMNQKASMQDLFGISEAEFNRQVIQVQQEHEEQERLEMEKEEAEKRRIAEEKRRLSAERTTEASMKKSLNDEKIKKVFERVVKALGVDDDINDDGEE